VTRRKSQEKGRTGRTATREDAGELQRRTRSSSRNAAGVSDEVGQENNRVGANRKPATGFSRTLIAKSEARPSELLVQRTENLQLDTSEVGQVTFISSRDAQCWRVAVVSTDSANAFFVDSCESDT